MFFLRLLSSRFRLKVLSGYSRWQDHRWMNAWRILFVGFILWQVICTDFDVIDKYIGVVNSCWKGSREIHLAVDNELEVMSTRRKI